MTVMILSALLAAALYGTGAAVEQRQAAAAPESSTGRPRLLVLLARQPLWLLGFAVQVTGFAAHAVALRSGPLDVVQMLVASELVVAVLIVRLWSGRRLSLTAWAAALTVVAGIASFLLLTASSAFGRGAGPARDYAGMPVVLGAAMAGAAAAMFAVAGLRAAGRRRAALLAVAAGLGDACSAVVTMAFSHVATHGPAAVATSWTIYALIACGAGNVLLTQTAYQTGRPLITLPVISAVTPVASVAIGLGLLGETPGNGLAGGLGAGVAVVVTSLALVCLARSVPDSAASVREAKKISPNGIVAPLTPAAEPLCSAGARRLVPAPAARNWAGSTGHRGRRAGEDLGELGDVAAGAARVSRKDGT
jgi:drug/metabolite transporter (DMT)-like permease